LRARTRPKSNQTLLDTSARFDSQPVDKATEEVNSLLNKPAGAIGDQEVSDAIHVAKMADEAGNHEAASSLYDKLAVHLTELGRGVQAAALLSRRTPQGLYYSARKALNKAGVEISETLDGRMRAKIAEIKGLPEGSEARDYATKEFEKLVQENVPSDLIDKLTSTWKAGLLTGVKTQTGNALSNSVFGAAKTASDVPATVIDMAISKLTGQRTKTLTMKGLVSGAKEGGQQARRFMKTGIDERGEDTALKFDQGEVNFKNPVLNTYVNGVFRAMGAADRPFYYSSLRNSLQDLAKADAINNGARALPAQLTSKTS
jgi:hypothetical protein